MGFSGGGVVAEIFRRGGPGLQNAGSSRTFALIRHFYIVRLSRRGGPPGSATANYPRLVSLTL